jgi:hypothetical protein
MRALGFAEVGRAGDSSLHRAIAALQRVSLGQQKLSKAECDALQEDVGVLVPPHLKPGQLSLLVRAGRLKPVVDWMAETSFFAEDGTKLKGQLEVYWRLHWLRVVWFSPPPGSTTLGL